MKPRAFAPWAVGLALTAAACAVYAITPSEQSAIRAIVHSGQPGETVAARSLLAQMQEATFADRIVTEHGDLEGNWLLVTVTATAPVTEVDAWVGLASVTIDGKTFLSSDRVSDSLLDADLRVSVPTTGMIVFELPKDLTPQTATLRLSASRWTPELDDVIAFSFDASALPRTDSVELLPNSWEGTS